MWLPLNMVKGAIFSKTHYFFLKLNTDNFIIKVMVFLCIDVRESVSVEMLIELRIFNYLDASNSFRKKFYLMTQFRYYSNKTHKRLSSAILWWPISDFRTQLSECWSRELKLNTFQSENNILLIHNHFLIIKTIHGVAYY